MVQGNQSQNSLATDQRPENAATNEPALQQMRDAIPSSCFESSLLVSLSYLLRDFLYASALVYLALQIDRLPGHLQLLAWLLYGYFQGCVGTGLWILGHECGHGAFSGFPLINDIIGWHLHSLLLVPYFSWKITHARHHRYTSHIEKDVVFVPMMESEYRTKVKGSQSSLAQLQDYAEDTPIMTMLRLMAHQLFGWQLYLLFNVTSGSKSIPEKRQRSTTSSHFDPTSTLFLQSQGLSIVLSDLGLLLTLGMLYVASTHLGFSKVALLYFMPYLWVHHWLSKSTFFYNLKSTSRGTSCDSSLTSFPQLLLPTFIIRTPLFLITRKRLGHIRKERSAQSTVALDLSVVTSSMKSLTSMWYIICSLGFHSIKQKRPLEQSSHCLAVGTERKRTHLSIYLYTTTSEAATISHSHPWMPGQVSYSGGYGKNKTRRDSSLY